MRSCFVHFRCMCCWRSLMARRQSFWDTPTGGCSALVACKHAPSAEPCWSTLSVFFPFNNHSRIFLLLLSAVRLWATLFALSTNRRQLTTGLILTGYIKGWVTILASGGVTILAWITRQSVTMPHCRRGDNFSMDNFAKLQDCPHWGQLRHPSRGRILAGAEIEFSGKR